MTKNQPPTVEERLSRLENVFSNMGEMILAHHETIAVMGASIQQTTQNVNAQSATIDVLVANIQQLTENVAVVNQRVDVLTNNINRLAEEAAQDRQQAAIDRQQAAIDRQEIRRIWEYLRDRNGGSPPPQAN